MSYTRKVAYNTGVQVIGKVLTTLISLFLVAALTRYLGVGGYGQYTTIFAYIQFFGVFADFGFFWYLVREIAKPETDQEKIFNNVLTFRFIFALFIFGLSFLVGLVIPQYHDIRFGLGIIAAATFWLTLNSTYIGIFQNRLRMDKAALGDVLGRLVILGIVLYQIKIGANLTQVLWAYFVGNFINFCLSCYLGRIYICFRPAFNFAYWRKIFLECLPIFIVTILSLISFKIDTVMLSLMRTPVDVGIYGPPYKVIEILVIFPGIFVGNTFPIITRYIYSQDPRLTNAFQKSFDFLVIMAVPIIVSIIILAERIIEIVGGNDFLTAHTIEPVWGIPATSTFALQILAVAAGISFLSFLFNYTIIALGKQTKLIGPNIFFVLFNVIMNLILIPKISYIGAAFVTVLTEICVVFLYWLVMKHYLSVKIHLNILWKVALAGIILGLLLKFLSFLSLWFLIPISAVVYFLSLWLVGGISKGMIREIVRIK